MLAPSQLKPEQRRLVRFFSALSEQDRASLLAFAEFLVGRQASRAEVTDVVPPEPKSIERPIQESVVAAIRRLSESYYMLDRQVLFHETSTLMSAHILQGRPASDVIDDLEKMFADQYRRTLSEE